MRNLDRLNVLLKSQPLPTFRQTVGDNFNNLHWLQKHVVPKLDCDAEAELLGLLKMTQKQLLETRRQENATA